MGTVVLRTIILYICIVFAVRIMGKRQLGELQPSELVVTLLVSNIATLSIEDTNIPLLGSILPIFTLVSCEVLVSLLILKSNTARKLISGNPRVIIRDGSVDQKEMKNLRWSIDDLNEQLRVNGIFDFSEVDYAIVETSGALTTFQKFENRTATAKMLNIEQGEELNSPPITLISDGDIVADALTYCNVDRKWLDNLLDNQKLKVKDVFLLTCDKNKSYTIIKKEGRH